MILAAIYNVFDGEELLEGSIEQIREHCDYIIAVVQNISNHGNNYDGGSKEVARLQKLGLIDRVHYYKPDLNKRPGWNETKKRNEGLQIAKQLECTHFISMDCDEYYDSDKFKYSKRFIETNDINGSAAKIATYFGDAVHQLYPKENYFVPFICKIEENILLGNYDCGVYCDPTRKPNYKIELIDFMVMHHFSWVRNDIERKIDNSSANINLKNYKNELIEAAKNPYEGMEVPFYKGHKLIKTSDHFNINRFLKRNNQEESEIV